ncbi:drug/metabolite transporter (DMT)-like permease [Deinococcus metalli]|uniref:Permease n=1 Tax=Deinococcus metalli TaxID=1141878 RepID=A0A7W8KDG6_9DEIO|nr:DMT family transporter [Deinococcus metalli]MBB5376121.1 drug/metabolite transporter (DMT)-like permease [Deinococcus metalli]GHF40645.1 permease [Deinococcus metalli]
MTAPTPPTDHLRGVLLLILVTAIWGSTFAVVKTLGETMSAPAVIAWRFVIATVALTPLVWATARRRPPTPAPPGRNLWHGGVLLGAWLIASYGTQTIALQTTSANRAAFFTALSVVMVPVWLAVGQRRRMPLTLWLALPLAVGGLALLSWEGGRLVIGDVWALGCAFTYAGYIVILERLAHRHAALPFTLVQLVVVSVLAAVWLLLSGEPLLPPPGSWWPLAYLGVAATAVTTLLQTVGQRRVSAAEASLIYALEPVTATIFSFLLLGERVGLRGALGGALVVVATVLSQRGTVDAPPHAETPAPQSE